jgi:hypothetical protein
VSLEDTRRPLLVQGAWFVITGLAPFASRRAFEAMTGPKREWWLVQTVGALVAVVGAGSAASALRGRPAPEVVGIAVGSAAALAGIDVVHVARGRIAPTYAVDAAIELALAGRVLRALAAPSDVATSHRAS